MAYEDEYAQPDAPQSRPEDLYGGIGAAYKKYLGRTARQDELAFHARTSPDNYEAVIKGSSEAQAWNAKAAAPRSPAQDTYANQTVAREAYTARQPGAAPPAADPFAAQNAQIAAINGGAYVGKGVEQDFRNVWATTADQSPESLARIAQRFPGVRVSGDSITFPDGTVVDAVMNERRAGDAAAAGQNQGGWIVKGAPGGVSRNSVHPAAAGERPSGGGGSSRSSSSSRSTSTSTPLAPPAGSSNAQRDAFFQTLLARSKQGLGVNSQTDGAIRQQADPYEAAMIRAERERLADTAERRGPYANLEGERRLGAERVGHAAGSFEAGLVGEEVRARRDEIQNALTQMGGMLSQDQQEALQRELAMLDDRLKREQLTQQSGQFAAGMGLDRERLRSSEDQFMAEMAQRGGQWEDEVDFRNRGF